MTLGNPDIEYVDKKKAFRFFYVEKGLKIYLNEIIFYLFSSNAKTDHKWQLTTELKYLF